MFKQTTKTDSVCYMVDHEIVLAMSIKQVGHCTTSTSSRITVRCRHGTLTDLVGNIMQTLTHTVLTVFFKMNLGQQVAP